MTDQVSVDREVAAPADDVWAMVSDVTRMGEWSPETTACTWRGPQTEPVVGARFQGKNRRGWHRWSTESTVTEAEPGRSFVFLVKVGPLEVAEWAYRFEPTDTGCRVTETWTDRRGGVVKLLGRPASGVGDRATHNKQGMVETLSRLAVAAEAGSG